jgi:nicotinate phosphoribosyltransferase
MSSRLERIGLYTDLYELRMLETYLRLGMTEPATFSLFARPSRARPFMVTAGLEVALDVLEAFRFGSEELDYLSSQGLSKRALDWLANFETRGEMWAVPDGTVLLAQEPWLEMTAPLPVAQLLETALMNAMHGSTVVASKAARLTHAAGGRALVDFGFRRAHGLETGVRAAVAAYVGGCASTSNVAAGQRFGIPIAGTMAHSFVQAFERELDSFREFSADHPGTTLLVDTYDTLAGVDRAILACRQGASVGGIRIDSEPLLELSREARSRLDRARLEHVKIFVSGGLDEAGIRELVRAGAPIDAFGVGSALVCSSDKPALDVAYKLVQYAGRARAKYSPSKATLPGRKQVHRRGEPQRDVLELRDEPGEGSALMQLVWRDGDRRYEFDASVARQRAQSALAGLPEAWFSLPGPETVPLPELGPALLAEMARTRQRAFAGSPSTPLRHESVKRVRAGW